MAARQRFLKHQKQVCVDGAWSYPVSWKTSNCFTERQKAYNICLIPSAGARASFEVPTVAAAHSFAQAAAHTDTTQQICAHSLL